jgi:hypothetical protein
MRCCIGAEILYNSGSIYSYGGAGQKSGVQNIFLKNFFEKIKIRRLSGFCGLLHEFRFLFAQDFAFLMQEKTLALQESHVMIVL